MLSNRTWAELQENALEATAQLVQHGGPIGRVTNLELPRKKCVQFFVY